MSTNDVARDVIDRVLDRGTAPRPGQQPDAYHRGVAGQGRPPAQAPPAAGYYNYGPPPQQGNLPVYTTAQSGVLPPPLYQQDYGPQAASRGLALEYIPSRGTDTDFVNQAFSDALGRARQKWSFSLLISLIVAGLIIVGVTVTGIWLMMGKENALTALFGTGATIFGVLGWLLARPGSQLNDADNQVSLLMMIWTKYTQDLQGCERITEPTSAATCMAKAGDEAIQHFNSIVGKTKT